MIVGRTLTAPFFWLESFEKCSGPKGKAEFQKLNGDPSMKFMKEIWFTTVFISLFATSTFATDVTVGCPGGSPGQFPSITAALNSLDLFGPHTIIVTGTCTENLIIADRNRLTITAPNGRIATVNAAAPSDTVILLFRAHQISLNNLIVQGGSTGIQVALASDAVIQNCKVQNNSGDGVLMQSNSTLDLENSTSQKNGRAGLSAESDSNVTLSTFPTQRIHFNNNGYAGINVDRSYLQINFGTVTVENNIGPAIFASGGRLLLFGDNPNGIGSLFRSNGEGIDFFNATSATFFGLNKITNNGAVGLQVQGSSLQLYGGALPNGSPDGTLIEGHTTLGVNVTSSADVMFDGSHTIRRNGTLGADPTFASGLRVSRASATISGGTKITGNIGPGILSDFNSSVQIGPNATISGNTDVGVRLFHMSAGNIIAPFTSNQLVTCDNTSLLFGDVAGHPANCSTALEVPSSVASPGGIKR